MRIDRLSYDPRYVEIGAPIAELRGDLRFLAEQMGLKIPILPISNPKEKKIFNDFMAGEGSSARDGDWRKSVLS